MHDHNRLAEALKKLRTLERQLNEQLSVIDAILNDTETPGQTAKRLVGAFIIGWEARYRGATYVPNFPRDIAAIKRLLAVPLNAEDIQRRIEQYLANNDGFYVENRHPLPTFVGAINKFGVTRAAADDSVLVSAPVDCRHRPPCRSDVQHTRRAMQDMRS